MSGCEQHQVELSALLDGESEPGAVIAALDHLVSCAACRDFYRELRVFQDLIDELPATATAAAPGGQHPAETHWGWNLAAMLVIGVGLTVLLLGQPGLPAPTGTNSGLAEAQLATGNMAVNVAMDDERFSGLISELLVADARYQRRMYALLADIGADRPLDEAPLEELLWRYTMLSDRHETDWYDFAIARRHDRGTVDNEGEVRADPENGGVLY